jgi:hypothetical protein
MALEFIDCYCNLIIRLIMINYFETDVKLC